MEMKLYRTGNPIPILQKKEFNNNDKNGCV